MLLWLLSTVVPFGCKGVQLAQFRVFLFLALLCAFGGTALLLPVRCKLVLAQVCLRLPVLVSDQLIARCSFLDLLNLELEASTPAFPLTMLIDNE